MRTKATGNTTGPTPQPIAPSPETLEFLTTTRVLFIIIAATVLVYANSLSGQFVFDDTKQILGNPSIHSWASVLHAFTRDVWDFQRSTFTRDIPPPYYRPFFTIYLTVGYHLFGLWEPGWHLLNLAIHTGATILVYYLVRRLSNTDLTAGIAALCFGLHPSHVESVSWISGIPDPLAALFFIPALIWYLKYRQTRRSKWLALSLIFYGLAALCKETALSLPMVIFVIEFVNNSNGLQEKLKRAVWTVAPYSFIALVYLLARFLVLGRLSWKHPMMTAVPDSSILLTIPYVVASYVRNLIFPYRLSLIYGTSFVDTLADPKFLVSSTFLCVVVIALWRYRRIVSAEVWIGLTLFLAPLLPVLNLRVFHFEYIIQDRYLYLPSIGFCYLLALAIARLTKTNSGAALFLAALAVVGYGTTTVLQNRVWHDPIALWQRAIEYSPYSWSTHYNLGLALLDLKQYEEARTELLETLRLKRSEPTIYNNLALAQVNLGDLNGAIENEKQALNLDPRLVEAHNNLGTFLYMKGDFRGASFEFKKSLELDPTLISARFNLARSLSEVGDHDAAIQNFMAVIALEPNDAPAHYQLGLNLAAINRKPEAISQVETALSLERDTRQVEEMRMKLEEIRR